MRAAHVLAVVGFLALAPMLLYLVPQVAGGERAYVVLSGSMMPTIAPGDYIVVRGFSVGDPLNPGDVITYRADKVFVTHRAVDVQGDGNERQVVTQGDANGSPDARPVDESNIVGVYLFHVPLYGHVVSFATQPLGKVAFIIVPSLALMLVQIAKLVRMASLAQAGAAAGAAATPPGPAPAGGPGAPPPRPSPSRPAPARSPGARVIGRTSATTLAQPVRTQVLGVRR